MKVRLGFVSNSSSVSFTIYGIWCESDNEFNELEARAGEFGLEGYPAQCDGGYIGKDWSSIQDNETGAQFKEHVKQKIRELLGGDPVCGTHSEGYYHG